MEVYFDNAATTQVAAEVLDAMMPYFTEKFGNPSSIHQYGRETKAAIEIARKSIAGYLNTSPGEIFFTSGGTESANMIINGAVSSLGVKNIITSRIEHHCVLHPIEELEKTGTATVNYVELDDDGNVKLDHLEQLLKDAEDKTLVCLMHANNEIGNILDIGKVANLCEQYKAFFFSDTVQTVAHFPIDLQAIPVHFITGSAHKFHGPKGVGFIYIRNNVRIKPLLFGGAQERNMRSGTENLSGIIGMGKAMELAHENLDEDTKYISELRDHFYASLKKEIPAIQINGNEVEGSSYKLLNISFPPSDKSGFLVYNLDINQIAASAGSACSSGSDVGSHVLKELNVDPGRSNVRFSFSRYNTKDEVDFVVGKLKEMLLVKA